MGAGPLARADSMAEPALPQPDRPGPGTREAWPTPVPVRRTCARPLPTDVTVQ
jgi:hypothetical protein